MQDTLEYIEDYFCNKLSSEEKSNFEQRCVSDTKFCAEVAFYVSTRDALKNEVVAQKRKEFDELYQDLSKKSGKQTVFRSLWPYLSAAAACLILYFSWLFFYNVNSNTQLADQYIKENLSQLSIKMGDGKDSLQLGINAYNSKNYQLSEEIFQTLSSKEDTRSEAIKNLGFIYLQTEKYNLAIQEFDTLSNITSLYANPGNFYKALVHLKRDQPGDKEQAKVLLDEVIQKKQPGYKEALQWKIN